jgi:uncharacterized membrane protein
MSKLLALIFEAREVEALVMGGGYAGGTQAAQADPSQALEMLKFLRKKAKEAGVELEDAVVVYKTAAGEIKIKQTKELTTGRGAGWGSFWGLLVGVLLGGPLLGILGGLGLGALYGRLTDHGISDEFIKDVGRALDRNGSALMLLLKDEDYPRAIEYLKTFELQILEANISQDTEKAVLKAAAQDEVAQAVDQEMAGS